MPKLSEQDAAVVDLILDHSPSAHSGGMTGVVATPSHPRLAAATKLLNLLDHLASEEPVSDLKSRTLQFIDRANARQVGVPAQLAHGIHQARY
jgi:hypothetical protein